MFHVSRSNYVNRLPALVFPTKLKSSIISPVPSMTEATRILEAIQGGEKHASADLLLVVYDELRQLAAQKLACERPGQTLQATALVHEAWLRLTASGDSQWEGRGHFFAAAAEAMRRILVENARRKSRPGTEATPASGCGRGGAGLWPAFR